MKYFYLILLLNILIISACGEKDETDFLFRDDWGYESRYTGNAAEAQPTGTNIYQEIVKPMITAINISNSINAYAVKPMMPNLFDDNLTFFDNKTDNGTCRPIFDNGTIEYRAQPASSLINNDNYTAESDITYKKYCVLNNLNDIQAVVLNKIAKMKTNVLIRDTFGTKDNYSQLVSDNMTIGVSRATGIMDNYTFRGVVTKFKRTGVNDNVTQDNITISADMPEGETVYRYDMRIFNRPDFRKSIEFYHPLHGYVTVDLKSLGDNLLITNGMEITVKSKDGECIFKPEEIGTNDFNCEKK